MRLPAATLLLLFTWHAVTPLVALATMPVDSSPLVIAVEKNPPLASWAPRPADAREMVQPPGRQVGALSARSMGVRGLVAAKTRPPEGAWAISGSPVYPSRRFLRRVSARHAPDESPA